MLYSKMYGRTNKSFKEFKSVNATLLQKAGFIEQAMAGVYYYLPLGLRVLSKIEQIIRDEMNKISSEMLMPSIVPQELWKQTGRLETVDVLMKTVGANKLSQEKNDAEYVLNSTHEDTITPLTQKLYKSYKDFPISVYQIQTKFRNEPRAKSGLLRCREFRMKDLYSFHTSVEDLKKYYEVVKNAYWNVFERVGLKKDTYITLASGGDFTDDYSHEFQTLSDAGEDVIFHVKSKGLTFNKEVTPSKAPEINDLGPVLPRKDIKGEGIIGVNELAKFLNIPIERTTKTMIFETDEGKIVAAAVRGGYNINEEKLKKIVGAHSIKLVSPETVKKVTGAEIGYAGILNLPSDVQVVMDESLKGRKNFECGANKTHYHSTNINFGRDVQEPDKFYDIKIAKEGDVYPETGEKYEVHKAAEVGNIFPLYTKFTKAFNYYYTDAEGKEQPIYMGCYGIGSSRIMGVIVEKFHDEKGIMWPENVAPFHIHLIGLDLHDDEISKKAHALYKKLTEEYKQEVLFDDRVETRAGEKFADADLIGIPVRLVISKKSGDKIEYKKRAEKESKLVNVEEIV
ncbi:MAG: proline--tRNA ligase [bacterium]|nr:proline--tRNA ligase [bacterium]